MRWLAPLLVVSAMAPACDGLQEREPPRPPRTPLLDPHPHPTPEEVYAPDRVRAATQRTQRRDEPAFVSDDEYATDESIDALRLIYRVTMLVPESMGRAPETFRPAPAELDVFVSADRLRARFNGAGWAFPPGAEVRIRRDQPGVYVFDAQGGRPLGPGQLAAWFTGGRLDHRRPDVRVFPPRPPGQTGLGDLMCRLVAEWASQSTETVGERCGTGGSPPVFRVGPWLATRTADIEVEVPRDTLRADEHDPPDAIEPETHRAFLSPAMLGRIDGRPFPRYQIGEPVGDGLTVDNRGSGIAVLTLEGVPIGYLAGGASAQFLGVRPGVYRLGAMRPFGATLMTTEPIVVPGSAVIYR